MKKTIITAALILLIGISLNAVAEDKGESMRNMMMQQHKMPIMMRHHVMNDNRISLDLPPGMRQRQLATMRSHLEAVQSIIGLLAEGEFDKSSTIAHRKLGLTPEMKKMCDMLGRRNKGFREMGLAFHKSADELGDVLKTKDLNKSLRALNTAMNSCVQCHATFRQ
ncbi:MAG: cytochrome C [Mariprofundaceae bacterium]|nr:cytochrome C [Mariprofundaceae bacterium]